MKQYERFAECMRRILEEKGVTITELTRSLGYKSRNSLFRILNDQTSNEVEAEFFQILKKKNALKLSEKEWAKLEESLEISRVGLNDYLNNLAIKSLVADIPEPECELTCVFYDAAGERREAPFAEMLQQLAGCTQVEMLVTGCCRAALFGALVQAFTPAAAGCQISMQHYMFAGKEEIIRNLVAIQPVMYKNWYKAYLIAPESCTPEEEALLRVNSIMLHAVGKKEHWLQMLMLDEDRILCGELPDDRIKCVLEDELRRAESACTLLKSEFSDLTNTGDDYLRYTEQYRLLEKNCRIFSLKPDVPINYIHPDILISPVLDGFSREQVAQQEEMEQLVRSLYAVQMKRYNNFFGKKKVTHTVFSLKAMERFTRTGKQSDHFFAIRPYNRAERKAILMQLREQAVNNPFFWIYFLEDREMDLQAELTLYEGRGLMFMQADTKYKLTEDHSEALVNNPALNEKFKTFFMKDLLVNHVMEYQEGIAELDKLIQQLD